MGTVWRVIVMSRSSMYNHGNDSCNCDNPLIAESIYVGSDGRLYPVWICERCGKPVKE
jgi:hypothetical protein